jgi:uncharacterized membrane protein
MNNSTKNWKHQQIYLKSINIYLCRLSMSTKQFMDIYPISYLSSYVEIVRKTEGINQEIHKQTTNERQELHKSRTETQ